MGTTGSLTHNSSLRFILLHTRYIEIYPLVTTIGRDDADDLRTALISGCGSFVGLFGKKEYSDQDESAKQLEEDGMFQEMRIARENMKALLPVGSTGYTSRSLWQYVDGSDSNIYKSEATLKGYWDSLNKLPITDDALIEAIIKLLDGRTNWSKKTGRPSAKENIRAQEGVS